MLLWNAHTALCVHKDAIAHGVHFNGSARPCVVCSAMYQIITSLDHHITSTVHCTVAVAAF